nr:MAG TPA: hypothetical protein [Caudoviricetes sp.]DAP53604.1 MAG TPA: hypothetical protein [Caudoviricetes sp.]
MFHLFYPLCQNPTLPSPALGFWYKKLDNTPKGVYTENAEQTGCRR